MLSGRFGLLGWVSEVLRLGVNRMLHMSA